MRPVMTRKCQVNILLDKKIHARAKKVARQLDISYSKWIEIAIKYQLIGSAARHTLIEKELQGETPCVDA